jgi:hypothetical protein
VACVSLSLFILPAAETKCERNSEDIFIFPHFVKVIDDDDAFADDDFVALLWRNNATVVYVEIVKALVFFFIIPFSF